jgi:hypothetical protein
MAMAAGNGELPTISVGSWPTLSRCDRRLAIHLGPDRPTSQPLDDRFRLKNAVVEAIRGAHTRSAEDDCDVADVLDAPPPKHLEPEEQTRFGDALEAYGDAVSGRDGALRVTDDTLTRDSRNGAFRLTGRPDLVFDLPDGGVEVRRVGLSPRPAGPSGASPATNAFGAAMRLLLRPAGALRVLQLHLVAPGGCVETVFDDEAASTFGREMNEGVESALASAHPAPTPGWWCNDCPSLINCPAVPQSAANEVFARW